MTGLFSLKLQLCGCDSRPGANWELEACELGATWKDDVWSSISPALEKGHCTVQWGKPLLLSFILSWSEGTRELARSSVEWPGLWTPAKTGFPSWFCHLLAVWPGARGWTSPPFPSLWSGENDNICLTELPEGGVDEIKYVICLAQGYHGKHSENTGYIILIWNAPETIKANKIYK